MQAGIVFNKDVLPEVYRETMSSRWFPEATQTLTLSAGKVTVPWPAKSLTALVIRNLMVTPASRTRLPISIPGCVEKDLMDLKDPAGRAMILNLGSANRYAYVYLEYSKHDYKKVELVYDTGSGEMRITKDAFPWEFTVPLTTSVTRMSFHLSGHRKDGTTHTGETYVLSRQ
jgi:hypothetical protein